VYLNKEEGVFIKIGCLERHKKLCDLSEELGFRSNRISCFINGFQNAPKNLMDEVRCVFSNWDKEDKKKRQRFKERAKKLNVSNR
jgi:hypothetical protein